MGHAVASVKSTLVRQGKIMPHHLKLTPFHGPYVVPQGGVRDAPTAYLWHRHNNYRRTTLPLNTDLLTGNACHFGLPRFQHCPQEIT